MARKPILDDMQDLAIVPGAGLKPRALNTQTYTAPAPPAPTYVAPIPPPQVFRPAMREVQDLAVPSSSFYTQPVHTPPPPAPPAPAPYVAPPPPPPPPMAPPPPPPPAPVFEPLPSVGTNDWRTGSREARLAEAFGGEQTAQGNFNYPVAPPAPSSPPAPPSYTFNAPRNVEERANNVQSLEYFGGGGGGGVVSLPDPVVSGEMTIPELRTAIQEYNNQYNPAEVPNDPAVWQPSDTPAPSAFDPGPAAPSAFDPGPAAPSAFDPGPVAPPIAAPSAPAAGLSNPPAAPSTPTSQAQQPVNPGSSAASAAAIAAASRRGGSKVFGSGAMAGHFPKLDLPDVGDTLEGSSGEGNILGETTAGLNITPSIYSPSGNDNKMQDDPFGAKLPIFEDGGVMPQQQAQPPMNPQMAEMNINESAAQNPQQMASIREAILQEVQSGNLTMEELNQMVQLARLALQNPQAWPQIRAFAIEQGIAEASDIPQQYDAGLVYTILIAGKAVQDGAAQGVEATGKPMQQGPVKAGLIPKFENGGVVPTTLSDGHKLAYIKPGEAVLHVGVVRALGHEKIRKLNEQWNKDGSPVEKPAKSSK